MERIVECVPNFSEGRDMEVIGRIAEAISEVSGIRMLDIDPGAAANRTVITFTGSPEAVSEAAFRGVEKAAELIDMRLHHGTHPRMGATDVLPFVPVSGITLEECVLLARNVAGRIFTGLGVPCYCYEAAAYRPERRRLEICRHGEYEALPARIADPELRPDFSPETFTETAARAGATIVGARNFLIAVNFNLEKGCPESVASEIAKDVRESGRTVTGPDGSRQRIPGTLKGCKAIGWHIEEYGIAQVSMNITDIAAAPLHMAYSEVKRAAEARGVKITGTEIIGLVPRQCLLDAGRYFIALEQGPRIPCSKPAGEVRYPDDDALLAKAVETMHLDDLRPFDLKTKLI